MESYTYKNPYYDYDYDEESSEREGTSEQDSAEEGSERESDQDITDLTLENLKIVVEEIDDYSQDGIVGKCPTYLGMKNKESFMIATKGFRLFEDGYQVSSGLLPNKSRIREIAYNPYFNCYFISSFDKLYKKTIDNKPLFPFLGINCGGRCLISSHLHQRLFIKRDFETITMINLKTKKIELKLEKTIGDKIIDFRMFGDKDNRFVCLTKDGYVILYGLDYAKKRGVTSHLELDLIEFRQEKLLTLELCDKKEYALIEIATAPDYSSRMVVLKLTQDGLTKMEELDHYRQYHGLQYTLGCLGYFGSHILWVGLTFDRQLHVYDYDIEANELKELADFRTSYEEFAAYHLHRIGNKFYYTGNDGKLMRLSLRSNDK